MAGIFGVHTGAWGTPDFGISEKIGDLMGKGRNSQGGSTLSSVAPRAAVQYSQPIGPQPATKSSGSVLGWSGGSSVAATSRPQQQVSQQPQQIQQDQPQAPDLYAEIGGVFDDLLGSFGGQQADLEGRVQSAANTQKTGINEQLGYGIENLNTQRGTVRTNQANTLADLAQNMRDQARNVGNYLGARGSGNSSANEAASFALQKVFGKERAGVQRQGMQQLGDIDMAETNLKAKASEMTNGVDTWFNSQMVDIQNQFNTLRNNIGSMKGNMRAQAIETLYNAAQSAQQQRDQYMQAIQESAMQRLQSLNDYKLQLQQSSQFDPQQMVYNEYGFDPAGSYAPENYDMFNPLAMSRKKLLENQ